MLLEISQPGVAKRHERIAMLKGGHPEFVKDSMRGRSNAS